MNIKYSYSCFFFFPLEKHLQELALIADLLFVSNNAGIMATPFMLSKDNIELQFATNHIGEEKWTHQFATNHMDTPMIHKWCDCEICCQHLFV